MASMQLRTEIKLAACVMVALATVLTIQLMVRHMRDNPHHVLGACTARILFLVPIYSIEALCNLWSLNSRSVIVEEYVSFRKFYEAVVVFSFLQLVLVSAGGPERIAALFTPSGGPLEPGKPYRRRQRAMLSSAGMAQAVVEPGVSGASTTRVHWNPASPSVFSAPTASRSDPWSLYDWNATSRDLEQGGPARGPEAMEVISLDSPCRSTQQASEAPLRNVAFADNMPAPTEQPTSPATATTHQEAPFVSVESHPALWLEGEVSQPRNSRRKRRRRNLGMIATPAALRRSRLLGWLMPVWPSAPSMLRACVFGPLLYVTVSVVYAVLGVLVGCLEVTLPELFGATGRMRHAVADALRLGIGLLFVTSLAANLSLHELTKNVKQEIQALRLTSKLWSIKIVVFITFWQSLCIQLWLMLGVESHEDELHGEAFVVNCSYDLGKAVQNLLLCFELLAAAIFHMHIWRTGDFQAVVDYLSPDTSSGAEGIQRSRSSRRVLGAVVDFSFITQTVMDIESLHTQTAGYEVDSDSDESSDSDETSDTTSEASSDWHESHVSAAVDGR